MIISEKGRGRGRVKNKIIEKERKEKRRKEKKRKEKKRKEKKRKEKKRKLLTS